MDKVSICNLALNRLGIENISSLTEESEQARKCKASYDIALETILREFDWNFTTKMTQLALIDDTENLTPGWKYKYTYPVDCVKIRRVFSPDNINELQRKNHYRIINFKSARTIATNIAQGWVEYTARVSDTGLYDSQFADALAWRLAAELATALTGKEQLYDRAMNNYQRAMLSAYHNDGKEENDVEERINRYEEARW